MSTQKAESDHAQNTVVSLGIAMLLVIGAIATVAVVFDGVMQSKTETPPTKTEKPQESPASTKSHSPTMMPTSSVTPVATPSATPPPSVTQTQTPTTTPTVTATLDPAANERYSEFVATVFGETEVDAEVPVRLRGWRVLNGKELVIVMNLTSPSEDDIRRAKEVNILVTSGYAQAVAHYDNGNIGGEIPNKLRIAEVNNIGSPPKTLYVNTSLVRDYYTGQLTAMEFTDRYWSTETNMSEGHIEYVQEMDRAGGNSTLYNESAE